MKLKPLHALGLLTVAGLCACGPLAEQPHVAIYPTEEPSPASAESEGEIALNYLAQVYPDARGSVNEIATKIDGNTVMFVSAVEGMQIETYTYMAFQSFLRDSAVALLPDVFTVEPLSSDQVVYLIPRSAAANSSDPLAGVSRTIQTAGKSVTFLIIEPDGTYSVESIATEIAQATYHDTTLNVTGIELDPYQEVLANSIGLAFKLIYVDGMSYDEYVAAVQEMVFNINGTMYNVEVLSPAILNYAMYLASLPPDMQRGFIRQTP